MITAGAWIVGVCCGVWFSKTRAYAAMKKMFGKAE